MDKRVMITIALSLLAGGVSLADGEFEPVESRLMPPDQGKQWVKTMQPQLAVAQQEKGPFGRPQKIVKKKIQVKKAVVSTDPKAFAAAVAAMKVPIVMGNVFVIGTREFKKGEVFSLERKGNVFKVEVISVNTNQIILKNLLSQEQVIKHLNNSPLLQPDNGIHVEGMERADNKSPGTIEVDE